MESMRHGIPTSGFAPEIVRLRNKIPQADTKANTEIMPDLELVEYFIWGSDYNFTYHNFRKETDVA